ncbi:hypothetical protein H0H93_002612 [Arthromyces matolae]|nr:hypothetical protein H0H93_002612 [Arthromyces matolae]
MADFMDVDVSAPILHRIEFTTGMSNLVILSSDDRIAAKQSLFQAQSRAQSIQDKIDKLTEDLVQEKQHITRLQTALAPHKALPPHVLSYIFELVSPEYLTIPPSRHFLPTPWSLREVCSHWRSVAVSHLSLWNRIQFHDNNFGGFKFWIQDIAHPAIPLSLSFPCSAKYDDMLCRQVLLQAHGRVGRLRLSTWSKLFYQFPSGTFPLLKSLDMLIHSDIRHIFSNRLYREATCFTGMRNLDTLSISLFKKDRHAILFPNIFPWHQLHTLRLTSGGDPCWHVETILGILVKCQNLVHCEIEAAREVMPPKRDVVTLPFLTHLTLHYDLPSNVHTVLDFLEIPALKSLTLETSEEYEDYAIILDYLSLIRRSKCSLTFIEFDSGFPVLSFEHLKQEQFSSVSTLVAPHSELQEETLAELLRGEMLPKLESISLRVASMREVEAITSCIERQASSMSHSASSRIREVKLLFLYDHDDGYPKGLSDCQKRATHCGATMDISTHAVWTSPML